MSPAATLVRDNAVRAAHRRDHHHDRDQPCRPHSVEVIYHGREATVVCHCCATDQQCSSGHAALAASCQHSSATTGP